MTVSISQFPTIQGYYVISYSYPQKKISNATYSMPYSLSRAYFLIGLLLQIHLAVISANS